MKEVIFTPDAPKPLGPYNQGILAGGVLYTSGQIAIDPKKNELISGTIEEETHQVMENLQAVLKAANMTFENVVKTNIFLSDINLFTKVNAAYAEYFNEETAPARETVEVANLPKLVNIEISCIAVK